MYPATIFNWHDQSQISTETTSAEIDDSPLLMQVFSSDKGTEDLIEINDDDFDAMYGTMSFQKHGQSAIQAKAIVKAGGRLLAKRVVADDATLANVILCAHIVEAVPAEVDPETGAITKAGSIKVKWVATTATECKTFADVKAAAKKLYEANSVIPLIIYADNGRGESVKAVRLTPDYAASKTIGKTFYAISVYEGTKITEKKSISFDPTVIYNDNAYRLDEYTNVQISGYVFDDYFEEYVKLISDTLCADPELVRSSDIINGYTNRGAKLDNGFVIDADSVDLDAEIGIALSSGSNGEFGAAPVNTSAWTKAIVNVFKGKGSLIGSEHQNLDEVFDVDQHKIAAILDADYPIEVKNAIFDFVTFRKDCVFLRDYSTDCTTYAKIQEMYDKFTDRRNFFTADYCTSYLIEDPVTKKNIPVTCMYDMAIKMVNALATNPFAPICGIANGFILDNAIEGTISFTPINTPSINMKELMEDIKVNYAIFQDRRCVMQSCYSSQLEYTQLSWINNVIGIQTVLRAVRKECPAMRYSLVTGSDLSDYSTAVSKVLGNYTSNFNTLNFIYTQDKLQTAQKIFYASIEFAFLNWAQTEIFDVYAINNNQ